MRRLIIAGLMAFAVAIAPPALAADWEREVYGWNVGRAGDTCVMMMEYEGEGSTQLALAIRDDAANTFLIVNNYGWSTEKDDVYELKYHQILHNLPISALTALRGKAPSTEVGSGVI